MMPTLTLRHYTPPLVFLFAFILSSVARSPAVSYRGYSYLWLIYAVYLCEWIALFTEVGFFSIQKRRSRVLTYIILLVSSSAFLPFQPIPGLISFLRLDSYELVVALIAILGAALFFFSFVAVLAFCLLFDWDLPLAVRFTPFMFSLLDLYYRLMEAGRV
jgi:hypothetical protein